MAKKRYIIPIFIPHEGCPHDCSFCNQKKITGITANQENVENTIEKYLKLYPKSAEIIEIAFYGGSFTGLPIEKQIQLLRPAYNMKKSGYISDIRLSTRPDYISKDILNLLKQYGVSIIELGLQSTDDNVLFLNGRGHTRKDIFDAVYNIREYPFKIGLQMMIGLFADNIKTINRTVEDILLLKPDFVRIYPTIVIKDTHLETLYKKGVYKPYTLERAVSICKELLLVFKKNDIPVIRLGLQATDDINYGKALVAGPYHPAFREIVETEIYRDLIEEEIKKYEIIGLKELIIYCHPRLSSKAAGFRKSNKNYFMKKYNFSRVKIIHLSDMKQDSIKVEIK